MAEYFVGPVLEKLIDGCYQYLKNQLRRQTYIEEELQKLQLILPNIQVVVSTYNQVEIEDPALNKCLWQLRDAIDEADDVLDEFEYKKIEEQVSKNKKIIKVCSLMKSLKKRLVIIGKHALNVDPNLKKLEVAVKKLYIVSAQVSTFMNILDRVNQEQQQQQLVLRETRETGSMTTNELVGRSEEMEFVRQWLRKPYQIVSVGDSSDSFRNISLLCVVGHGGMGKTTLLQHVYEDEMMNEFDVKIWICVSTNFKAKNVIANMLKSLKTQVNDEEPLERLQRSLQSEVSSKRFLIVLDDIWDDDERDWKKVLDPLSYGSSESKILITTRMDSVASTFAKMIRRNKEVLRLDGLEEDECLVLFNTHAFAGVENPDSEFKSIAKKMIKKLSGCPLVAKVIGGILNLDVNKSYWTKVLNTSIGNVGTDQNHLLPILKLSYRYLPKFLQNCFSFCCIFKQDHEFDKDDLVRMWIALGFVQLSNISGETLEDTGRRYFNILFQKSFFDEFHTTDDKICYKMHDLLHELAQSVSKQECFRIVDDEQFPILPETIRHLSINTNSREVIQKFATFQKMGKFNNLRSLFMSSLGLDENVISEVFKSSKSIRLLVISPHSYKFYLPETVGCLTHLRYLKVECPDNFKLPRSIRHLYHLQFIISEKLNNLEMDNFSRKACNWLQVGIRNCSFIYFQNPPYLIRLMERKQLKVNENCQLITDEVVITDPSVLLIEPLRSISFFHSLTIEENNLLASFSSKIEQWFLQHHSSLIKLRFNNLRSLQSLHISLESLSSLNTIQVSNLASLQCITSLSTMSYLTHLTLRNIPLLKSLPELPSSLEYLFLEALQCCPPSCLSTFSSLQSLVLKNIPLKSLPDLPSSLIHLKLDELKSLQCLPSSLATISSLKHLTVSDDPQLKLLPNLPASLTTLHLLNLESLLCLPSSLSTNTSLNDLFVYKVPQLKLLPNPPASLTDLILCNLESLQCLPSSLSTLSSLQNLKLKKIPLLKSLSELPTSLEYLRLEKLMSLKCLPTSLSAISSLENLELKKIPLLKSLSDLPSSLHFLRLEELENFDGLPSSLPTSLDMLWIIKIPRLLELPDLPASLKHLYIDKCHPQLMNRYKNFDRN